MWSLGCILGEMLTGKPLFPGTSTVNQIERIMAALPKPSSEGMFNYNTYTTKNLYHCAKLIFANYQKMFLQLKQYIFVSLVFFS